MSDDDITGEVPGSTPDDEPEAPKSPEELEAEVERLRGELDATQEKLGEEKRAKRSRLRNGFAIAFAILGSLLLVVSMTAVWARGTILNTDRFVNTVGPMIDDPAVTKAVSIEVTDDVFQALDVQGRVASALAQVSPKAIFLSGPITNAAEGFVQDQVNKVLLTSQFEQVWRSSVRFAHEQTVKILEGGGDIVRTEGGQVTLNLLPLVNEGLTAAQGFLQDVLNKPDLQLPQITADQVPAEAIQQLSERLGVTLPSDLGQITVYSSEQLKAAQDAVKAVNRLVVLLVVLTLLFLVLAFVLSTDRRRTLLQVSAISVLGFILVRRLAMAAEDDVTNLATDPTNRAALKAVLEQFFHGFFVLTWWIVVVGLIVVVVTLIMGPYDWAVRLRRKTAELAKAAGSTTQAAAKDQATAAWVRDHRDLLAIAGVVAAVVLFLVFSLSWWSFLLIAVLLGLYEFAVFRLADAGAGEATAEAEGQHEEPATSVVDETVARSHPEEDAGSVHPGT